MIRLQAVLRSNMRLASRKWGKLSKISISSLNELTNHHGLSIASGDLLLIDGRWYVTHAGLLGLARRSHCSGIGVQPLREFCDPSNGRYAFKATVYKSRKCRGFVGYGDADPSNVSALVRGAEMRVAETRAVNRALRKAYGIGICSVEEIGSLSRAPQSPPESRKLPRQPANGNYGGPKVRDRLYQIIRQNRLDPNLVKAYATDFCGTKTPREATREQVENFVAHLADWADKDRNAPALATQQPGHEGTWSMKRRIQGLGETARSSGRGKEPVTLPVSSWPTLLEPLFWQFRGVVRRSTCAFAHSPLAARDERREDLSLFSSLVGLNLISPLTRKARTYLTMLSAKLMLDAKHGDER